MIAVDTNILIYACDQADPRRQTIALDLITNSPDLGGHPKPAINGQLKTGHFE